MSEHNDDPDLKALARKLRERFREVLDEPIPQDILDLLTELERLNSSEKKSPDKQKLR